ncbi:DsrE family protein [Rhodohalobacter sp.]|uniref:DsrE family protein n=1 Tax=Rhodohalobacter sp. TaxID=1974210 RepID=UPI002ACE82F8|nr:DsrE family protein [Rhodohalobacter sp.]MDZ7756401.1 DsrE family protein [Rhodohalobacter sp.]
MFKKLFLTFSVLFLPFLSNVIAQEANFPIIKNYGGIYEIPNSVDPEPDREYKIVIDLKTLQRDKSSINPGLNNVARMINLHALGGVKHENLKVSVAIHGGATDVTLTNKAYQKRYEMDNPNILLIKELKEAGVELYVCGQSLIAREYEYAEIHEQITFGLSMLTVFTTHVQNGYVPLIFD